MLRHLQVRNLVVVETLALELAPGMTAFTGETGAGKSILVDALALALGAPADQGLIRDGADRAEVEAVFDLQGFPEAAAWLEAQALEADGECILRRVLVRGGRSRAFVNGRAVPSRLLAELGGLLVEIHGQHEHQRLLRPAVQRSLLDAWAGHGELVEAVRRAHHRRRRAEQAMEALHERLADRERRLDYLRFQVRELEPLVPLVERLESLEQEHRRLASAESLLAGSGRVLDLIEAGEPAALELVAHAQREAEALVGQGASELTAVVELLDSARIQLEEAAGGLREFISRMEPDPARLATLDGQLGALHDAARKHRVAPVELADRLESLHRELSLLEAADQELQALEAEAEAARRAHLEACRMLTRSRKEAAAAFAEALTRAMQTLAMEGGRFEVALHPLPETEAGAAGAERVEFLVATNPGQAPAPLARVASGGELSRLSLAIQVAVTAPGGRPTLVFDEVDVGIGGAVAETVGRLLRRLGENRQVFCVTHLPQVAAQAHHQFKVSKLKGRDGARTTVQPLEGEERVREIARMSGGRRVTKQALAHARALMAEPQSRGRLGQSGS